MKSQRSQLRHSSRVMRRRTKPTLSLDYIVGLTDGEGCFYVCIRPPFNRNGGGMIQLSFYIKMQEKDRSLLHKVCNTLGCGNVYFQHEKRPNHTQCYRYSVGSHRDILGKIIPFFKEHPLQSVKKENFKIFCKIAKLVSQGKHHNREGIEVIRNLKLRMNRRAR
ncbi:MAG: LAGLIDADG family homing endonuclease [Patescibacteria group bacterium]